TPPALPYRVVVERQATTRLLRLREVGEWTDISLEPREAPRHVAPRLGHESVSNLCDEEQASARIVPHEQGIEAVRPWQVATHDELLPGLESHLQPRAAPSPRLVNA